MYFYVVILNINKLENKMMMVFLFIFDCKVGWFETKKWEVGGKTLTFEL